MRSHHPNCIVNYNAPGPGLYPLLKNRAFFQAVIETAHEASLSLLVIGRKEKREQIKATRVLCE